MGVVALWLRHDLHSCRLALAPEGKSAETTILSYFFLGRRLSSLHAGEPKSLRRPSGYLITWAAAIFSTSDAPIITSLSGGNPGEIYWCLNYHLTFPLSEPTFNPEVKEHRKQSCISVWLLTCAFRAKGHEILNQVELIVCVTALSIHTPVFFFFLKIWILHLCQQEVPLETGDDCQMKCSLPLPWHWIEWIISARFTEGEAGVFLPAAHRSPAGSDSTAAAVVAKTGFGKDGSSLSQDDSAAFFFFFFTRRSLRCHDTERGGKSLLWYCHGIVRGQPQMTGGSLQLQDSVYWGMQQRGQVPDALLRQAEGQPSASLHKGMTDKLIPSGRGVRAGLKESICLACLLSWQRCRNLSCAAAVRGEKNDPSWKAWIHGS